MRIIVSSLLIGLSAALAAQSANACDWNTGSRDQMVVLTVSGKNIETWTAKSDEIKSVTLPSGFKLGVKIEPADQEFYKKQAEKLKFVDESVKITLFNVSRSTPKQLTYTWGGTNSIQGYGANGGADRVVELGNPGIVMTLLKPVCAQTQ
ncbi:MAG: hypothetical protein ABI644_13280 [Arenimonas sp.]